MLKANNIYSEAVLFTLCLGNLECISERGRWYRRTKGKPRVCLGSDIAWDMRDGFYFFFLQGYRGDPSFRHEILRSFNGSYKLSWLHILEVLFRLPPCMQFISINLTLNINQIDMDLYFFLRVFAHSYTVGLVASRSTWLRRWIGTWYAQTSFH